GEEYTDNLNLTNTDREYEYITSISPGLVIDISGRSAGAILSYNPSYNDYSRFSEHDDWEHSASVEVWADLSRRTRLTLGDEFELTDDPVTEDDVTVRRSRAQYYTNTASAELAHQFGIEDSLNLHFEHRIRENDDPTIADNEYYNPSVTLTYWVIPNSFGTETGISYTRGEIEGEDDFDLYEGNIRLIKRLSRFIDVFINYDHTVMDYDGTTTDYQIYDPSAGFTYTWDENASFSLDVGHYFQDRETGEDESGVSIEVDISKTWTTRRGSIGLTGTSGYEETYFGSENLGFTKFYEVSF
ncbi:MAG: outer membrane beta-barrel protein, partial [Bacteroides sp.]|nr:outer membrane beta-barrel protein [Bacteroides sp.]